MIKCSLGRYVAFLFVWLTPVCFATVIIHNETLLPIYAGVYYYSDSGISELKTPQVNIVPGAEVELQEPPISILKNRYIFADTKPLPTVLSYEEYKTIAKVRVRLPGHYYVATKDGRLKAYTLTEWHIVRPFSASTKQVSSLISQPILQKIRADSEAVQASPYKNTPATTARMNGTHPQEELYRTKRKEYVKKSLEKLLGRSLDGKYIPEITLITSGGGYRAMLYSAGVFSGLDQAGIFDTLTYISTLSGSTWALGTLMLAQLYQKKSPQQVMYDLIAKSTKGIGLVNTQEVGLINDTLMWKSAFDLPITTIDLYGLLLGTVLFQEYGPLRHRIHLSDQVRLIEHGTYPFPIYTAVPAETTEFEKVMYEFTPYEVRAPWNFSIPAYAFGSRFVTGNRVGIDGIFPAEQPMSILFGVFGSAYAFTLKRAYEELAKKIPLELRTFIEKIDVAKAVGQKRIAAALFSNFMMGVESSPIKNKKNLKMADAGLGITGGLPFQPVSGVGGRRKADIYIIVDISDDITGASDLKKIATFMASNQMKFPPLPQGVALETQMMTQLSDLNDSQMPIVFYMPRAKDTVAWNALKDNPDFIGYRQDLETFSVEACLDKKQGLNCTTLNFSYSPESALKLARLGEFNMRASKQAFVAAINQVIDQKSA